MAIRNKASLVSERYEHTLAKADVYAELRHQLELVRPETETHEWADLSLDLANSRIGIGRGEDGECSHVATAVYNLSAHAEAQLCDRIGLGKAHELLSPALYRQVEAEYQELVTAREDSFTIKHRGGIALALLTDDYKEIPYDASIGVLEDLGARPIRLTLNDTLVKVQAIFDPKDFEPITPSDDEPVSIGIQMRSSDVGASALHFEVFSYRWICSNGMTFGKNNLFKFRTVHLKDRSGTAAEADREIKRVLSFAREEIQRRTNELIGMRLDTTKRLQIVRFIGKRGDIGKKAAQALLLPITEAVTVYDVVNILTREGHNPRNGASLQMALEQAAGDLLLMASA